MIDFKGIIDAPNDGAKRVLSEWLNNVGVFGWRVLCDGFLSKIEIQSNTKFWVHSKWLPSSQIWAINDLLKENYTNNFALEGV